MDRKVSIAILLVFILLGAGLTVLFINSDDERAKEERWYNVDIIENVYSRYQPLSEKENFYAYSNGPVLQKAAAAKSIEAAMEICDNGGPLGCGDDRILEDVMAMLEGDMTVTGDDLEILRAYSQMTASMDDRNEAGIGPVTEYVMEIDSIDSLDEMTAYIADGGSAAMYRAFFTVSLTHESENGYNAIALNIAGLPGFDSYCTISEESTERSRLEVYEGMLDRFDIDSDTYMDAIGSMNKRVKDNHTGELSDSLTYTDLKGYNFPFADNLKRFHEQGIGYFVFYDSGWMGTIDDLYTEENLMMYKSVAMYSLLMDAAYHLDETAYGILGKAFDSEYDYKDTYDSDFSGLVSQLVGKHYFKTYADDELIEWFADLTEDCRGSAKAYFDDISWIGPETKMKIGDKIDRMTVRLLGTNDARIAAEDKIDRMTVRLLGPNDEQMKYIDYSSVPTASYYDMIIGFRQANEDNLVAMSSQDVCSLWTPDLHSHDFNMYYDPSDNSINLLLGFVREFLRYVDFDYGSNYEFVLGTIGASVCHEITHGFDEAGSGYTPEGAYDEGWLFTEKEKMTFEKRVDALRDYITGFYVGNDRFLTADHVSETMADMGGSAITCSMLRDGSDHRKYFEALALLEFIVHTEEDYYDMLSGIHPPGMYRVNMEVQQMQKFFDVYGITEGDGMFLAEKDRVNVW